MSLPGAAMYRAGCDTWRTVLSLAANMASARPAKHKVNPRSARGLKNPASPGLLRKDSRSERRLNLSGARYLFFIVLDLVYGRTFLRCRNGCPCAGTARRRTNGGLFQESSKPRTLPFVIGSPCISQAF